jgi:hypothetical protein
MAPTSRCSVVDVPVQDNGVTLTRRSLLGATVALAVAGCRSRRGRTAVRPTDAPLADRAAIESAAELERTLIARYDAAVAQLDAVAAGPLSRARDRHLAHLDAFDAAMGRRSPSSTATPAIAPDGATSSGLTAALTASAGALESAAVRADSGQVAALLASVAAEHAAYTAAAGSEPPS